MPPSSSPPPLRAQLGQPGSPTPLPQPPTSNHTVTTTRALTTNNCAHLLHAQRNLPRHPPPPYVESMPVPLPTPYPPYCPLHIRACTRAHKRTHGSLPQPARTRTQTRKRARTRTHCGARGSPAHAPPTTISPRHTSWQTYTPCCIVVKPIFSIITVGASSALGMHHRPRATPSSSCTPATKGASLVLPTPPASALDTGRERSSGRRALQPRDAGLSNPPTPTPTPNHCSRARHHK